MEKKQLIVGLDPGTTVGYAILDLSGNVMAIGSRKHMTHAEIINILIDHGKPIILASDKKKTPDLNEKIASNLGARVIVPDHDLTGMEKKDFTAGYDYNDDHQKDALAAARYAIKSVDTLMRKLNHTLKDNSPVFSNEVKKLVIKDRMSIAEAKKQLETPTVKIVEVVKTIPAQPSGELKLTKRLREKIRQLEKEKGLLKVQNEHLTHQIKKKPISVSKGKLQQLVVKRANQLVKFKENRLSIFSKNMDNQQKEIEKLQEQNRNLNKVLANVRNNQLLKKLPDLGRASYEKLNNIISIEKNDMLLVENPEIYSQKIIDQLNDKVHIILTKKKIPKKLKKQLPFIVIEGDNMSLMESRYFCLINKSEFDKVKKEANLIGKIIEEYKASR